MPSIEIVPEVPFDDGVAFGKDIGRDRLLKQTDELLNDAHLRDTLGQLGRDELTRYVRARLETPPDTGRYPELEDIHPERVDYLRGVAAGAEASLDEAAVHSYVTFRQHIDSWHAGLQLQREPEHCSGIFFDGPDGVIGGQSVESTPPPRPDDWKWQPPATYSGLKQLPVRKKDLVLKRPRTGYIASWGFGSEKGVACFASVSCSVWLDERIEDTWPIGPVPVLRFARDARHLAELFERYTLHNWTRANQIWGDVSGEAFALEKCFRRIGIRFVDDSRTLFVTEGHFETPHMHQYIREKRHEYVKRMGRHLGSGDLQYATDCHVRFTRLAALANEDWGRGYDHIRRVLTDHAPFPRAVCRHNGPDTAAYDETVTMDSGFRDLTHNRTFERKWDPWRKFCCEMPEEVTQFPPRPC